MTRYPTKSAAKMREIIDEAEMEAADAYMEARQSGLSGERADQIKDARYKEVFERLQDEYYEEIEQAQRDWEEEHGDDE